jgi:large subunit ribosomal protein L11
MPPKKVAAIVKVILDAGQASPITVGKALGPRGINMQAFIRAYNERTGGQRGDQIPAEITIYEDRSFTFETNAPPTAYLLRRAAGIDKGDGRPNGAPTAWITGAQLRESPA